MRRRRVLVALLLAGALAVIGVLACQWVVLNGSRGRLYSEVAAVPAREVGLVLGTSERLGGGGENPFFRYRIEAAAALYKAGKVKRLLVSGDNAQKDYNEPVAMKAALVAQGVPAGAVVLDYAGFRTLDSVVRAKKVFGLSRVTVISQRFHDERALLIAGHYGLDAIGFCAGDVALRFSVRTRVREVFARVKCVLDLYLLHTKPRFLGKPGR